MKRVLLLTALACALPSVASAQTVVVFPVGGDPALASAHGDEVFGRVQREFEESGMTVLASEALVEATTTAHAEECIDPTCAPALLTALHASLAVGVALWNRNGLVQVSVVLRDEHGTLVSADADGAEGVVGQAVQGALSQARARWATREGSPIRVVGSPEGASVTIDHDPVGSIPYEGHLSPGTHHFVVSADAHVSERRDVEIAAATTTIDVRFELVLGNDTRGSDAAPTEDGRPIIIGLGVGVMAAGIGLAIPGIANVATAAEQCASGCDGPASMRDVSVPHTDAGFAITIVGAAVFAVGLVVTLAGASASANASAVVSATRDGVAVHF